MLGLLVLRARCLMQSCCKPAETRPGLIGVVKMEQLSTGSACAWQASGRHLPQAPVDCRKPLCRRVPCLTRSRMQCL